MSSQFWFRFVGAMAIAICLQSSTTAQIKSPERESSGINLREQLASDWSNAVITNTLLSPHEVKAIQFSPDGQLLAVVGASQIAIWNLQQGQIQRILPGHHATEVNMEIAPTAIAFSPDSRFIATGSWSQGLLSPDQAIIVRDITTGESVLGISESDGCRQVLFDESGEIIYGACGLGVTAWSVSEGKKLFNFAGSHPVEAIALSPDGQMMATVNASVFEGQEKEGDNQIQLWQLEAESATLVSTLDGLENDIANLEFTGDGKRLVSSSYDGKVQVWNWQQVNIERQTNNLYSNNGVFSISADSKIIAGSFHNNTMIDLRTGLPLINLHSIPPRKQSNIIAFSPQEQLFARVEKDSDSSNYLVKLWQVGNSQSETLPNHRDNYRSIPLAESWSNQEQSVLVANKAQKTLAIGQDIQVIALQGLGFNNIEDVPSDRLEIKQDYPQDNLATVTITQTKLEDDSVEGHRYLLEFAPYGDQREEKWQLIWAGEQFRCWSGRGHQDWGTNLCH
ncbi:MAG: hypothetical protein AAGE84_00555 [Cyanobacteria bacterium P01_G01_bin.39]